MDIALLDLRAFVAVAAQGSISRAAGSLRMQQPTLSRAIAELEQRVGAKLFERLSRGVALTERGTALYDACAARLEELDANVTIALQAESAAPTIARIGASEVVANVVLPRVRAEGVVPYVLVAPTDVLIERLRARALDCALVMHAPTVRGILARPLAGLPHRLVVARRFRRDRTVLACFIGSREVEDPANRSYPTLVRLRRDVPNAGITASSNSLTWHKTMVLAGEGVSILPEALIEKELRSGALVPIYPRERPSFPVLCLSRAQTVWRPGVQRYVAAADRAIR